MSTSDDRRSAEPVTWADPAMVLQIIAHNQRIATMMAQVARLHGGGAALEEAKREFHARGIAALYPVPGQRLDSPLTDIPITKGKRKQMLKPKDLKRARRVAKSTGCTLEAALVQLSRMSKGPAPVPSYRGGDVLRKAAGLSGQEQRAVTFALNHKMDGRDPETDRLVFKALHGAMTGRQPGHIVRSTLDLLTGGR